MLVPVPSLVPSLCVVELLADEVLVALTLLDVEVVAAVALEAVCPAAVGSEELP